MLNYRNPTCRTSDFLIWINYFRRIKSEYTNKKQFSQIEKSVNQIIQKNKKIRDIDLFFLFFMNSLFSFIFNFIYLFFY